MSGGGNASGVSSGVGGGGSADGGGNSIVIESSLDVIAGACTGSLRTSAIAQANIRIVPSRQTQICQRSFGL